LDCRAAGGRPGEAYNSPKCGAQKLAEIVKARGEDTEVLKHVLFNRVPVHPVVGRPLVHVLETTPIVQCAGELIRTP
jgi:hypothetical protein